jgi:hypothetical protein
MSDSQPPENATNNPGSKALLNEFTQLNEGIQHVQKIVGTIKTAHRLATQARNSNSSQECIFSFSNVSHANRCPIKEVHYIM